MIYGSAVDDARATGPVERLLEDSWEARSRHAGRRELVVETGAALLFLAVAIPLAVSALATQSFNVGVAVLLVALYAVVSRAIKFPIGAGYVVPSYLVLVPMLILLPPGVVPLLAAAGLVGGTLVRVAARRAEPEQALFSIPDAIHTLGPALVLTLAVSVHGNWALAGVYVAAFMAGCVLDLLAATVRESAALGVAPRIQLRVIVIVWLIDACIAPLGLLVAHAARNAPAQLLLLLPLTALVVLVDRDRSARITEAQHRLGLVALERTRLQAAVKRLGEAFAAKLDLGALGNVVLHGSMDALGGDAGHLILQTAGAAPISETSGMPELEPLLESAARAVQTDRRRSQFERDGAWALALPIILGDAGHGALVVARRERAFREDEQSLMADLVERAQGAAAEIVAHDMLREQAMTDPLTRLGNRRKLADELRERLARSVCRPAAGAAAVRPRRLQGIQRHIRSPRGRRAAGAAWQQARRGGRAGRRAFRLGGDEFCAHLDQAGADPEAYLGRRRRADRDGADVHDRCVLGAVILPQEATTATTRCNSPTSACTRASAGAPSVAGEQAADVLLRMMRAKQPGLDRALQPASPSSPPSRPPARDDGEELDELARAARTARRRQGRDPRRDPQQARRR